MVREDTFVQVTHRNDLYTSVCSSSLNVN